MKTRRQRRFLSVKLKLTLWFTAFMAVLAAVCLAMILVISGTVTRNEARQLLTLTVRANIPEVSLENGHLSLSPEFQFYSGDVYMMIYNKNMALLTGQTPPEFPVNTPPENGIFRAVSDGGDGFYIMDFWIPSGWDDGIWLRGALKNPGGSRVTENIITLFSAILPFFILAAAMGGYIIVRRAMAPISHITEVAEKIGEGKDLTRRIGISRGSFEVVRLAGAFDRMFERLEKSFEAEKQFTSDASHELRTPTSVILAQCSFAARHGETLEDYKEAIQVIDRQAGRMALLIEQLLSMTRLDLGTQKLLTETVDLSGMVQVLCEEQDTGDRGISMETQIAKNVRVKGDPLLLSRAIVNLLDNARKYGKENGHIWVCLSPKDRTAVLRISDDGIGIAPDELDKIWQRFYQVGDSRQPGAGLGLGLAMVRQIVKLHGGCISAGSVLGEGSRFTVTLPLAGDEPAADGNGKAFKLQDRKTDGRGSSKERKIFKHDAGHENKK